MFIAITTSASISVDIELDCGDVHNMNNGAVMQRSVEPEHDATAMLHDRRPQLLPAHSQ